MTINGSLILFGLFGITWGLSNAFSQQSPRNTFGALFALIGLTSALVGTLLVCVPDFFPGLPW
jgi:hypothetical protein